MSVQLLVELCPEILLIEKNKQVLEIQEQFENSFCLNFMLRWATCCDWREGWEFTIWYSPGGSSFICGLEYEGFLFYFFYF